MSNINAYLETPSEVSSEGASTSLNCLLASVFTLYIKTKNFHWHLSGPHFRDYHLMFDEQATQLFDITDDIAERVRKIGGLTIHSVKEIYSLSHIKDNTDTFVTPADMLSELLADNQILLQAMRTSHQTCEKNKDFGTTAMLEVWMDQAERRIWFLFEASREL